jgi:hypothetical protein
MDNETQADGADIIAGFAKFKEGHRRANLAALYAHLRTLLAMTRSKEDPITGIHGVAVTERMRFVYVAAGATPPLPELLSMIGHLQGKIIEQATARQIGDLKGAGAGDRYNPELDRAQCVQCEDGDPDGSHAEQELRDNGKAWLGLCVEVAQEFYGPYLSEKALALLAELTAEALPAGTDVS